MSDVYILVSGGFDPPHSGHLAMFREASQHGNVICLLNSDDWLARKKGKPFMNFYERSRLLGDNKYIYDVVSFDDSDGTACDGIRKAFGHYFRSIQSTLFIFANGGDRKEDTTPSAEQKLCEELGIEMVYGVGGRDKANSSSSLLSNWTQPEEIRPWGSFRVLREHILADKKYKIKEIIVNPKQRLSLQSHRHRREIWYCLQGQGYNDGDLFSPIYPGCVIHIESEQKHRLVNTANTPLIIVEIQEGDYVGEDDITRYDDIYNRV